MTNSINEASFLQMRHKIDQKKKKCLINVNLKKLLYFNDEANNTKPNI